MTVLCLYMIEPIYMCVCVYSRHRKFWFWTFFFFCPLFLKTDSQQAPDQDDFARYEIENPAPPVDRWSGCYLIFLMLGVGGMWPWNGFLTAFDYFFSLFPNLPSFQFIMSIVFNIATVTFQFLGVAFGNKVSFFFFFFLLQRESI